MLSFFGVSLEGRFVVLSWGIVVGFFFKGILDFIKDFFYLRDFGIVN